ncbi:hypothetical protein P4238_05620 [Pseudomonas aeruginosa]|nr:hypothetical protein [Pseudomonas aeruginosa]
MIQAGIHVGAGVVLGVAAGWWLGDWEQSLQVKDSVARVDCLLYGALLVVLLRHDGWLRRLGLLGLGLFCGSLLVYSVNPASLFATKESWSLCADLHAGLRSAGDAGRRDGLRAPGTRLR